jgi:hypothetical protein
VKSIFVGIIAIYLLIGPFQPAITDGIKGWRTNNTTESFVVTTNVSETSQNVTLGHDLYQSATGEVISITSNATETPVASDYDTDSLNLLIGNLDVSTTRLITVNYYAETDSDVMRIIGPFLSVFIFGGLSLATIAGAWAELKPKKRWGR